MKKSNLNILVLIVSVVVIISWMIGWELGQSLIPDAVTMKFSTATMFLFASIGGIFKKEITESTPVEAVFSFLILGMLFAIAYKLGIQGSVNTFEDNSLYTTLPGLPSIATLWCFLTYAFYLLINHIPSKIIATGTIGVIGSVAIIGHALSSPALYYFYPRMSWMESAWSMVSVNRETFTIVIIIATS